MDVTCWCDVLFA